MHGAVPSAHLYIELVEQICKSFTWQVCGCPEGDEVYLCMWAVLSACLPTGDRNYPWKTRTKSTYDIALADATEDAEYLSMLRDWIPGLFDKHSPQLVFFQAGVDALGGDSFGRWACLDVCASH